MEKKKEPSLSESDSSKNMLRTPFDLVDNYQENQKGVIDTNPQNLFLGLLVSDAPFLEERILLKPCESSHRLSGQQSRQRTMPRNSNKKLNF